MNTRPTQSDMDRYTRLLNFKIKGCVLSDEDFKFIREYKMRWNEACGKWNWTRHRIRRRAQAA